SDGPRRCRSAQRRRRLRARGAVRRGHLRGLAGVARGAGRVPGVVARRSGHEADVLRIDALRVAEWMGVRHGLRGVEAYLIAPPVTPSTKSSRKKVNSTATGTPENSAPAINEP